MLSVRLGELRLAVYCGYLSILFLTFGGSVIRTQEASYGSNFYRRTETYLPDPTPPFLPMRRLPAIGLLGRW
jgi:hypothetical protein